VPSLFRALKSGGESRSDPSLSLEEYAGFFTHNGLQYPFQGAQSLGGKTEDIASNFEGYVQSAYKANGIVFACMLVRLLLFSEARFQFRRRRGGRPGELFGTPALKALEEPWTNGTTGRLLTKMIQDVDLAGNFYALRRPGNKIRRLRPDWVTIILGSEADADADGWDVDAEVLGYAYQPGGPNGRRQPEFYLPELVAHWAPIPDPLASYRGMSWLTPVVREIMGDQAATTHKLKFFEQGATPNVAVSMGDAVTDPEDFKRWMEAFDGQYKGVANAYKTMWLAAGAKAEVIGADMKQIDFKTTQGAGETRIAAAAGVPPVIVGLSEGLQAATYSNYGQARRRLADGTMRPLWRDAAGALASIIDVPPASELWYDDRDIPFLQEDQKDAAEIQQVDSSSIKQLVEAGFTPESVVLAVKAGDLSLLKHTGLYSVQLQPANPAGDLTDGNPKRGVPDIEGARIIRGLLDQRSSS
jgi:hypothetical protein